MSGSTTETIYGFSGTGDSPDFTRDSNGDVREHYVSLPGGVMFTRRYYETDQPKTGYFSIPDLHGDVMFSADDNGYKLEDFQYDPFGNTISATKPNNTDAGTTWAWVGQHQKLEEKEFSLKPVQMGVRVYLAVLGRFLQVDPVEGGVRMRMYIHQTL